VTRSLYLRRWGRSSDFGFAYEYPDEETVGRLLMALPRGQGGLSGSSATVLPNGAYGPNIQDSRIGYATTESASG
jgi:hypothetical protein